MIRVNITILFSHSLRTLTVVVAGIVCLCIVTTNKTLFIDIYKDFHILLCTTENKCYVYIWKQQTNTNAICIYQIVAKKHYLCFTVKQTARSQKMWWQKTRFFWVFFAPCPINDEYIQKNCHLRHQASSLRKTTSTNLGQKHTNNWIILFPVGFESDMMLL